MGQSQPPLYRCNETVPIFLLLVSDERNIRERLSLILPIIGKVQLFTYLIYGSKIGYSCIIKRDALGSPFSLIEKFRKKYFTDRFKNKYQNTRNKRKGPFVRLHRNYVEPFVYIFDIIDRQVKQ